MTVSKTNAFVLSIVTLIFLVNSAPGFCQKNDSSVAIVPTPQQVVVLGGEVTLTADSTIFFDTRENVPREIESTLEPLANVLAEEIEVLTGLRLNVKEKVSASRFRTQDIRLEFESVDGGFAKNEAEEDQQYSFNVDDNGISIRSQYYKGVAYGTVSLIQAIVERDGKFVIPRLSIRDRATDDFRNILIDVARNPIGVGVIKDVIRLARLYKVRYVQLHLTDDQSFTFPFQPIIEGLKNNGVKNNSYTREELVELVAYADARGVTLIPELELPGHSTKITQSGYLSPRDKNHAQIADPANFEKLNLIVDDVLDVFRSSPYFHMGGDESGAGQKLIPLVAAINQHVRGNPVGGKRRLLVWEGFHGAPTKRIPPTGDDRVIVMAWESSYNAPWDLLNNGYEIINASWKPTYIVGGFGGLIHAGSGGVKKFALEDIYAWDKSTFMHWEPGRPVYQDVGPKDPVKGDHLWNAEWIGKQSQIIGGMLLYWEQREGSTVHYLLPRVPVFAQRLWNPNSDKTFDEFSQVSNRVGAKILPIVQPVEILPSAEAGNPVSILFRHYKGDSTKITLKNRTRINGQIKFAKRKSSSWQSNPNFNPVPIPDSDYRDPVAMSGEFGIRAALVRDDGSTVGGHSWAFFANWPMKVKVTEFDIGGTTQANVPDLAELPQDRILNQYEMPYIRGLLNNQRIVGQMSECDFVPTKDGEYEFDLRTQSGHATLYVDLNQNSTWDEDEVLIRDTPNTEQGQTAKASFRVGQRYRLRLDHSTGLPRPVMSLSVTPPGGKRTVIDPFIEMPSEGHEVRHVDPNSSVIEPFKTDYQRLAFYPDRWRKAGLSFDMLAWEGENIVFVTRQGEYDSVKMTEFVHRLDAGWDVYAEMVGKQPRPFKLINDKPVICAIPKSNLSCGYGCGFVGATGIEASAFYNVDFPNFLRHPKSFQHYYFYEMWEETISSLGSGIRCSQLATPYLCGMCAWIDSSAKISKFKTGKRSSDAKRFLLDPKLVSLKRLPILALGKNATV